MQLQPQREKLAVTINEYKDVLSSGPADMGQTGVVTQCTEQKCTVLHVFHPDDFPPLNKMW